MSFCLEGIKTEKNEACILLIVMHICIILDHPWKKKKKKRHYLLRVDPPV